MYGEIGNRRFTPIITRYILFVIHKGASALVTSISPHTTDIITNNPPFQANVDSVRNEN